MVGFVALLGLGFGLIWILFSWFILVACLLILLVFDVDDDLRVALVVLVWYFCLLIVGLITCMFIYCFPGLDLVAHLRFPCQV